MDTRSQPYKEQILIVDDDITILIAMRSVLEKHQFEVIEAKCASEALDAFERLDLDIIILDIELPDRNGLEVCEKIRAHQRGKQIPILMSTGMDDQESISKAYEVGATDFIVKPINWPIFGHRVRYMLRASKAIADIREAEQLALRLGKVIESSSNEIYIADAGTLVLQQVNTSARENLGYSSDELNQLNLIDLMVDYESNLFSPLMQRLRENRRPEAFISCELLRKDGSHYPAEVRLQLSKGDNSDLLIAIVQDVTERKMAEDRMRRLAYYDSLTGLPNRTLFTERLELMLKAAQRNQDKLAILFIDLDNFKRINDSLGHTIGDALLKETSKRLLTCIRQSDLASRHLDIHEEISVSRLGGDEFVIVLNKIDHTDVAALVAKRLLDTLSRPTNLEGHDIVITPSIGISIAPLDSNNVESLLKHADTAMYHAKNNGKNNYQYYSSTMNASGVERLRLESELRSALENDELVVYYQPQIDVVSGKICGAEALVRWQHPKYGLLTPDYFISLAEEMGIILELGEHVLFDACRCAKEWREKGLAINKMSVNISSVQFNQPNFVERIKNILNSTGLNPKHLKLELTESIIMNKLESTIRFLQELKSMGLSISIDDFGTGYSSLSYLKRFPIDELKIDRSFIIDIETDPQNEGIVTAIIAMANSLNLSLVAEGVETEKQLEHVHQLGVDVIQGYFFSEPIGEIDFEKFLSESDFAGKIESTKTEQQQLAEG